MVVTGSLNTISTKWADRQSAVGRPEFKEHDFDHPFLQAVGMFIGEFQCLIGKVRSLLHCTVRVVYEYSDDQIKAFQIYRLIMKCKNQSDQADFGNDNFSPFLLALPAMCDMCATSVMYFGLNLTFASSFQMLRGSVMFFTAVLSVMFLKRIIQLYRWAGIGIVITGLVGVGVSDLLKV